MTHGAQKAVWLAAVAVVLSVASCGGGSPGTNGGSGGATGGGGRANGIGGVPGGAGGRAPGAGGDGAATGGSGAGGALALDAATETQGGMGGARDAPADAGTDRPATGDAAQDTARDTAMDSTPPPLDATAGDTRADGAEAGATGPDSDKICGDEGWCWIYPHPQGDRLKAVWAYSRSDVWAVGERGMVLRYDGKRWNQVPTGNRLTLYSVWGTGPTDVWVGGEQNLILHWTGSGWTQVSFTSGLVEAWTGIHGTGPNDVWFVSEGAYASHWDGARWSGGFASSTEFWAESVWAVAPGQAVLSSYQGQVINAYYSASDNSASYDVKQLAPSGTLLGKVWGAAANDGWIGGAGDVIYHRTVSPSGTTTYTAVDPATSGDLHGVWGAAPGDVWAVGDAGGLVHWNGTRWSAVAAPTRFSLNGVWGTATDDVWVVGDAGVIMHWDGKVWTRDDRPTDESLRDVWAAALDDVWAVGDHGVIVRSRGNDVFAAVTSPTTENLARIWGASATDLWMVGAHGTVVEWDGTKMVVWPKLAVDLANVWGTSRGDIWASGQGALYHFDGTGWLALPAFEPSSGLGAMWTNDPDRLFVLGTSGSDDVIYDYRPSTGRWTKTKIQGNDIIWGSGPNDLWTSGYPGDGMHYDGTTWSYYRTDDLYDIWGTGGGDVWAVGFLGGIAHHGPGSGAWTQTAQNLRMTHDDLYGLHGLDAANIWAVGQNGAIVRRRR